jgi:hypothetical protein
VRPCSTFHCVARVHTPCLVLFSILSFWLDIGMPVRQSNARSKSQIVDKVSAMCVHLLPFDDGESVVDVVDIIIVLGPSADGSNNVIW